MDSVAQISKLQKLYQIAQHAEMIHISDTSADRSLAVDRVREQCRHKGGRGQ